MKENRDATDTNVATIEKDIINAQHFIDSIKTDKEYKEENGWHGYYNKEIVELARILENILSDYKRVLKENEEYYKQLDLDYTENNFISKQIVKDNLIKYQEEYELLLEHQSGKESNRTKYLRGRIHMCQELLESEE